MTIMADANPFEMEVFYDGGCPLCAREIDFLQRRDRQGKIRFRDIDASDFTPSIVGKTKAELMDQLHGRLANGTWIRGVEVFRRLYAAAGFGPLVFLSRLPLVAQLLDFGYSVFARNRLKLTGRCTADSCGVHSRSKSAGQSRST